MIQDNKNLVLLADNNDFSFQITSSLLGGINIECDWATTYWAIIGQIFMRMQAIHQMKMEDLRQHI